MKREAGKLNTAAAKPESLQREADFIQGIRVVATRVKAARSAASVVDTLLC